MGSERRRRNPLPGCSLERDWRKAAGKRRGGGDRSQVLQTGLVSLLLWVGPDFDMQLKIYMYKKNNITHVSDNKTRFNLKICFPHSDFTCPDRIASLIHSHLRADMQRNFWLLAGGCLSRCYHSCRLGVGWYSAGAHGEGFVEIGTRNNGPEGSGRGADDGDPSASLSAQTHGHFGLAAPRRSPDGRGHKDG